MIHHPWRIADGLSVAVPVAHLLINLLPRLQASGLGSQMTKTLIAALRDQGSPGVHPHVPRGNQHAAGFYRHIGFTELRATPDELPAPTCCFSAWTYRSGLSAARLQAYRVVTCRAVLAHSCSNLEPTDQKLERGRSSGFVGDRATDQPEARTRLNRAERR